MSMNMFLRVCRDCQRFHRLGKWGTVKDFGLSKEGEEMLQKIEKIYEVCPECRLKRIRDQASSAEIGIQ